MPHSGKYAVSTLSVFVMSPPITLAAVSSLTIATDTVDWASAAPCGDDSVREKVSSVSTVASPITATFTCCVVTPAGKVIVPLEAV